MEFVKKKTTDKLLDGKVQSHYFYSCEEIVKKCKISNVINRQFDSIYITDHGAYPTSWGQHKIGDWFSNYGLECSKEFDSTTQWE